MDNLNLISNFAEFKELKNIDKPTMIGVLEDVFRHALQKQYETDENFDVIINPEKGDLEIWRNRTVVEDGAVENSNMRHGQERAGAARRGDRRPRRPRTGAGAEGRRDSEGRVRITKTERKENNTIWVMKEN